jgi:hypothetical protein
VVRLLKDEEGAVELKGGVGANPTASSVLNTLVGELKEVACLRRGKSVCSHEEEGERRGICGAIIGGALFPAKERSLPSLRSQDAKNPG